MRKFFAAISVALFALFLSGVSIAAQGETSDQANGLDQILKNPEVVASLNQIEGYMKSITTMSSRFIQVNPDGSYVEGDMHLSRPGRMRFEYDPPVQILLVANGTFFIYVDKELKQVTHILLSSTPANIILDEDFSLHNKLKIIGYERQGGLVRVEVIERDEPDNGSALLTFTEQPMQLKQWTITDSQQNRTSVTLIDPIAGEDLDPELFRFFNPWQHIGPRDK